MSSFAERLQDGSVAKPESQLEIGDTYLIVMASLCLWHDR